MRFLDLLACGVAATALCIAGGAYAATDALPQVSGQTGIRPTTSSPTATTGQSADNGLGQAAASEEQPASAGDIVVTALKRNETQREVPATLLVRSEDDLLKAGVRSPTDLSQAFPGLTYSNANANAQPAIRGVTTVAANANVEIPVAVYIDGIYQPQQQSNNSFSLATVTKIDVLKGPQGTVFGRNVVGGAILVSTREPDLQGFAGNARGTVSNFSGGTSNSSLAHEENLFVSVPLIKDQLAVSVAGSYAHNQGYLRDLTPGSDGRYGEYERKNFQGKILWRPSDAVRLLFNARISEQYQEVGAVIRSGITPGFFFPGAVYGQQPWQTATVLGQSTRSKTQSYSLRADFDTGAGTLTSLSAYQKFSNPSLSDQVYSPACHAAFQCIDLTFGFDAPNVYSQEIDFASKKWGGFSFVAGVFGFIKENRTLLYLQRTVSSAGIFRTDTQSKATSSAGFAEATYDITPRLTVIGGVRYTFDDERVAGTNVLGVAPTGRSYGRWSATTTRFSVKYRPTSSINLYATYSEGYQPGFLQNGNFNNGGVVTPQAQSQRLTSYEAGLKFNQSGVSLNVSGFLYDYTNILVQRFTGTMIISQNGPSAKTHGVDADWNVRLGRGFTLSGGASWLPKADFVSFPNAVFNVANPAGHNAPTTIGDLSGSRLIRAPKLTLTSSLNYTHDIGSGTIDTNLAFYHSSQYQTQLGTSWDQRAYDTIGATIAYRPGSGPLKVTVYGRNLTNKAYVTGTVVSGTQALNYYAPPREIGLTLDYNF